MKKNKHGLSLLVLFIVFLSFNFNDDKDEIEKLRNSDITSEEMYQHIKYLSSDEMEGRFPGTIGDRLTEKYLISE
ncbi:MAG: hypothetical protein ABIY50_00580, partial [Ignavibacteria bacterium]